MFFFNGWPFSRIAISTSNAMWVSKVHQEFRTPTLSQMALEIKLLVMATRKLFGGVPAGHPWHKAEWRHNRTLATAGFKTNLPGLKSRPILRYPELVARTLGRVAAQATRSPLETVVIPHRNCPPSWLSDADAVQSLSEPTQAPPTAFCPLEECVSCGVIPMPAEDFQYEHRPRQLGGGR
jgi:hypothetical protein